jgi:hypothetical protein
MTPATIAALTVLGRTTRPRLTGGSPPTGAAPRDDLTGPDDNEDGYAGLHRAGKALGSCAQRARVKGAVTEQFDLIVTDFTAEELDRIRSTT